MLLAIPAVADGGFWGIFSVCALMSCFVSGSLLDAYTLDLLGEAHRDQFGQFSLWCDFDERQTLWACVGASFAWKEGLEEGGSGGVFGSSFVRGTGISF